MDKDSFQSNEVFELKDGQLSIAIGKPILHTSYESIENSQGKLYDVLKWWLDIYRNNVICLKEHAAFINGDDDWNANEIPSKTGIYYHIGLDNEKIIWSVTKNLTVLGIYYKKSGKHKHYDVVDTTIKLFHSIFQQHFNERTKM